jgi:hypothetical protein
MRLSSILATIVLGCAAPAPRAPAPPPAAIDDPYFSTGDDGGGGDWVERWREPLTVGGATLALVGQEWPGEGEAIVVERDGRVLGAYRFAFGGLGGTLAIAHRRETADRVVLELRAEGTTKGYWLLPGQEKCPIEDAGAPPSGDDDLDTDPCYVGPSTDVTYVELAIDARHVWLAGESDRAAPR